MLKGNTAVCGGSYSFEWKYVNQITLHDGTAYEWTKIPCTNVKVIFGEQNSVIIDESTKLPCLPEKNVCLKAKQLLAYIPHLVTNVNKITQFQSSDSEPSDSDDEQMDEEPYLPVYDSVTWDIITASFTDLKSYFIKANEVNFENAAGKHFLFFLMRFCCWINMDLMRYVNMGTCSSGEEQPGCSNLKKSYLKYRSDRSSSCRSSVSSTPIPAETPTPEEDFQQNCCNIYPDVVDWNPVKQIYIIDVEVKSGDKQLVESQLYDQMVALFRGNQKNMLGLIIKPGFCTFRILNKKNDDLRMYTFPDLSFDKENVVCTIEKLCKLIMAFIFCVDC